MPTFKSLSETGTTLGVPIAWLKREADAGRVPCLRAGRRYLFDVVVVADVLAERAAAESETEDRRLEDPPQ